MLMNETQSFYAEVFRQVFARLEINAKNNFFILMTDELNANNKLKNKK